MKNTPREAVYATSFHDAEGDDLKFMWDRHGHRFLREYLQRGRQHIFSNPQHYATRGIIKNLIRERNPDFQLVTDSWLLKRLIYVYAKSGLWLEDWQLPGKVVTSIAAKAFTPTKPPQVEGKISILDAGCGSGNFLEGFTKTGIAPYVNYTGIDISEKNIENCRMRYPEIRFEIGDIRALSFPDAAFDIALVSRVLEYLAPLSMEYALTELLRVTKRAVILNFFYEHDIPEHRITKVFKYHRNCISRRRLIDFLKPRTLHITIIDAYPPFSSAKIEYIDKLNNPNSLSTWVLTPQYRDNVSNLPQRTMPYLPTQSKK